jgi:hypothetical protein
LKTVLRRFTLLEECCILSAYATRIELAEVLLKVEAMKKMVYFFGVMLAATVLLAAVPSSRTSAGSAQKSDSLKAAVEAPRFTFVANIASPRRGTVRQLTSPYDLRVTKDTVVAYLPYFGRAYSAPLSREEAGIMFTSTNFSYTQKADRRGRWLVTIKTKDNKPRFELYISITKNGYATLDVVASDREGISFSGEIVGAK